MKTAKQQLQKITHLQRIIKLKATCVHIKYVKSTLRFLVNQHICTNVQHRKYPV